MRIRRRPGVRSFARYGLSLLGVATLVAFLSTTVTYATLSDTEPGKADVAAATVVFGKDSDGSFHLDYPGLAPGDSRSVNLTIKYEGSIPADIALSFSSGMDSPFCTATGESLPGGDLLVTIGDTTKSYCSLLGGQGTPLGSADPGTTLTKAITVRLTEDASDRYSNQSDEGRLILRASNGFSDRLAGSIGISTADFAPDLPTDPVPTTPEECADMSFDDDQVIVLEPDQHEWNAAEQFGNGAGPFLVFGTDGADVITGSNKADCIVGGGGEDTLNGGNGDDVLLGGAGADTLNGDNGADLLVGGEADDTLTGGTGKDDLYGEAGHDDLRGGNGPDKLDGGAGKAICDGSKGPNELTNCDPDEKSSESKERDAVESTEQTPEPPPNAGERSETPKVKARLQEQGSAQPETHSPSPKQEPKREEQKSPPPSSSASEQPAPSAKAEPQQGAGKK